MNVKLVITIIIILGSILLLVLIARKLMRKFVGGTTGQNSENAKEDIKLVYIDLPPMVEDVQSNEGEKKNEDVQSSEVKKDDIYYNKLFQDQLGKMAKLTNNYLNYYKEDPCDFYQRMIYYFKLFDVHINSTVQAIIDSDVKIQQQLLKNIIDEFNKKYSNNKSKSEVLRNNYEVFYKQLSEHFDDKEDIKIPKTNKKEEDYAKYGVELQACIDFLDQYEDFKNGDEDFKNGDEDYLKYMLIIFTLKDKFNDDLNFTEIDINNQDNSKISSYICVNQSSYSIVKDPKNIQQNIKCITVTDECPAPDQDLQQDAGFYIDFSISNDEYTIFISRDVFNINSQKSVRCLLYKGTNKNAISNIAVTVDKNENNVYQINKIVEYKIENE